MSSSSDHPLHVAPVSALTPRQRELAVLIARGYTNAQIARQLTLTQGTVANHVAGILQRLDLQSRTDVAVWAVQHGLLGNTEDRLLVALVQLLAATPRDVDDALDQAAQVIAEVLGAEKIDIWTRQPDTGTLVARGVSQTPLGRKQQALGLDCLPADQAGRAGWVLAHGEPFLTGQLDQDPIEHPAVVRDLGIRSTAVVPALVLPNEPGVLQAAATQPNRFNERDLVFLGGVAHWLALVTARSTPAPPGRTRAGRG